MRESVGRCREASASDSERWKTMFAEIFGRGVVADLPLRLQSLRASAEATTRLFTPRASLGHFSLRPELLARD